MLAQALAPAPDIALWQRIATCGVDLSHLAPDRQALVRGYAWATLRQDRARRLGRDADATPPGVTGGQVIPLPHCRRPRLTILPTTGPGDAA